MPVYLQKYGEIDDDDARRDEEILCRYLIRQSHHETVGNSASKAAKGNDELVDLRETLETTHVEQSTEDKDTCPYAGRLSTD